MIPVSCLVELFQKNEKEVMRWIKQNKITSSKIGNNWLIDEVGFYRAIRLNLKLSECDNYLEEEVKVRQEEITNILLELDDLLYLFKSVNKLSPVLRLLLREMATLIPEGYKRDIFVDIISGLSVSEAAEKYHIDFQRACSLHDSALKCINQKLGFIGEYRQILAQKELKIRRLEIINQNQEDKIRNLSATLERMAPEVVHNEEQFDRLLPRSAVQKLSLRLTTDLDLDCRCVNTLRGLTLETVEDLLRYVKDDGFKKLISTRNFGKYSLRKLKNKLMKAGIIDEHERSDLYEYLS